MDDCIFCKILKKEIPSFSILENENSLAFLDINPCAPGHTVVVPKKHKENIIELSEDEVSLLFLFVRDIVRLLKEKVRCQGFTIGVNHGSVAGQAVPHIHVHIIPRFEGDGGGSLHGVVKNWDGEETVEEIYKKLFS